MSLKAFHLAFITIAALSNALFLLWTVRNWRPGADSWVMVAVSGVLLVCLIPYTMWFLRKFKNESYL